jgi:DNA-binding response OmpR family regulator
MSERLVMGFEVAGEADGAPPVHVTTTAGRDVELTAGPNGGLARAGDAVVALARMEFALLSVLAARRRSVHDPERAFLAWSEIAGTLDFRSVGPDSDNVRELVRRVRRKLSTAGLRDLIDSRQGIGYRLNGTPR